MCTSVDAVRVIKRIQITYFSRATAFYRESVPDEFRVRTTHRHACPAGDSQLIKRRGGNNQNRIETAAA